ncbi:MAG TPA: hypothetical protein VMU76_00445 [Acidimicrobiales bacterium]|nr:hypothetical protein [Acidimicrobiales bacterium]
MAFALLLTEDAQQTFDALEGRHHRRVESCLAKLGQNPRHAGLNSHRYQQFDKLHGQPVWESYVENHNPSAWRVWWAYGPGQNEITVLMIGPHP